MIVVRITGGLGNQMFQYAAGKRLAMQLGVEMKLDTQWYDKFDFKSYGLDAFHIPEKSAGKSEIRQLIYGGKSWLKMLTSRARREARESALSYIKEKQFHFDARMLNLDDEVYLHGYWQSEKYFKDIEGEIRALFTFRDPGQKAVEMAELIHSCASVSLHVRRGDYLTGSNAAKFEKLPLEYYRKALELLENTLGSKHLFVFSDDIPWVRENIYFDYETTIVDVREEGSSVEDMWLMSLCRHNIIANSSYSWWGAWLNGNLAKTVIAPSRWFNSEKNDTRDLIPKSWIRL